MGLVLDWPACIPDVPLIREFVENPEMKNTTTLYRCRIEDMFARRMSQNN